MGSAVCSTPVSRCPPAFPARDILFCLKLLPLSSPECFLLLTRCEGRQALCWCTQLFLAAGGLTVAPSNCISICIMHWHWVSSLGARAYGMQKDLCVSSPSFLSSPATVLQAMGLVPGQIPSAGRKCSVSSLSQFLEEFRANPGGSEKVFPPTDCRAHAWERRIGSWKPSSRTNSQGRASEMARVGLVLGMTHASEALGSPNNTENQTCGHPSLLGGTGWGHVVPMDAEEGWLWGDPILWPFNP